MRIVLSTGRFAILRCAQCLSLFTGPLADRYFTKHKAQHVEGKVISQEQIAAIDRAIVFLVSDNPGCRLIVELETILVDCENGEIREYDVFSAQYKDAYCEECHESRVASEMVSAERCHYCMESEIDHVMDRE